MFCGFDAFTTKVFIYITSSIKPPTKPLFLFYISVYHVFIGVFFKYCKYVDSYIHSQSKRLFYETYFPQEISTWDGAGILKQGIASTFVSVALIFKACIKFFSSLQSNYKNDSLSFNRSFYCLDWEFYLFTSLANFFPFFTPASPVDSPSMQKTLSSSILVQRDP